MSRLAAAFCSSAALALMCSSLSAQRILATVRGVGAGEGLGATVAALGDVDSDAVADFAIVARPISSQTTPYLQLRSGRDARLLRTIPGAGGSDDWGVSVADIGDVNADGAPDLAVGIPNRRNANSNGAMEIYSGRDGALIATVIEPNNDSTQLGRRVAGVGDVDGDGVADFVATGPTRAFVRVYSGRTRGILRTLSFGGNNGDATTSVALLGDLNNDGVGELVAGDPAANGQTGRVAVFDLRTGAVLRSVSGGVSSSALGFTVAGIGDVDADGLPDFAASAPYETNAQSGSRTGAVYVFSGRNGNLLRTTYGPGPGGDYGTALASLGDVNGDGVPDFAAGAGSLTGPLGTSQGLLTFVSGLTGSVLMRMEGLRAGSRFGDACAGIADFDGDGMRDVLVGAWNDADPILGQGTARVVSGRLLARATLEGTGCGGGPFVPLLGGTRPIVGTTALLVGEWPPLAPGFLLLSQPASRPTNLGVPECNAWVDIASTVVLLPIAPGTGRWTLPVPVPALPGFAGLEFAFQVIYGPTSGPLGFDLTNGLRWRVGW